MILSAIQIAASAEMYFPDEEREFDVTISKGRFEKNLHFYGDTETWRLLGEQLAVFPNGIADRVLFELGSEHTGPYLLLEAYCYDAQGHTAVRIIMNNNEEVPHREQLEFSIIAEAASINILGHLLAHWQTGNGSEIVWEAQTS